MAGPTDKSDLRTLHVKLGTAWAQLKHLPRVWSLVWAASRAWTAAWLLLLTIQGLLPVATVYLTRYVVDGVVAAMEVGANWEAVSSVLWPAGLMGGVLLLTELISGLLSWIREHQTELIQDKIVGLIHDTSTSVDLSFYETPEYYDHLHRARNEAWIRPQKLIENGGSLVQSGITLVAMGAVLLRFSGWIPLILLLSTIPALHVVLRHAIRQHRWRLKNTADERRTWYYDHEITSDKTAAELRLFSLGDHFKEKFQTIRGRLRKERLKLSRDQSLAELGAATIALLASMGCLAWMGWRTLGGLLTLGELALFYVAFRQGQQMMRALLGNVGDIYRNILFLGDLFEFLDLQSVIKNPKEQSSTLKEITKGIEFVNVGFAYPGSDRKVLEEFDLTIPAKKIVAVVGPNGSGKSTLLRLICRLYDPQHGQIRIDGTDLTKLRVKELWRLITVMFQEPVHYSVTASQNISFGDIESVPKLEDIKAAAVDAGVEEIIKRLPKGYETVLCKWFEGGDELSAGEWQRVALARAFLRQAPIILLDEPTSAMDSWAEADWMERLRALVEKRTTIIITHRFTTAMCADIIHVMQDGCIVESGNHEELIALGGRYAQSWETQMRKEQRSGKS
ncbi:MAG: ABC transporter ATP-binding protein [Proteobacteria bacterium]|nr:ABC transporter ATP-binding protein [Pseudomonadota bacterium]